MSKTPLIESPLRRGLLLGGMMLVLFVGSLGAAHLLAGAPLLKPGPPPPQEVELAGAVLQLPMTWGLESEQVAQGGAAGDWTFVNATRPSERLRVLRFTVTPQATAGQVASQLLPQVIGARILINTPTSLQSQNQRLDLIFSTQRLTTARIGTSPQTHAVTLFSPNLRDYWLFQLTDVTTAELWNQYREGRQLELQNFEQLRRLLADARFTVATPAPAPGSPEADIE